MSKIAVLIDGGFARHQVKKANRAYTPVYIERIGLACKLAPETIQRILYYDCAPYHGTVKLPVSGANHTFGAPGDDGWLHELSRKDLIAVRRGVLKFRGFVPKTTPIVPAGAAAPTDADFAPDFEQKGVDMRIGLDMANYAANGAVDLIALLTNDTDCIPAMKYARRAGLQVALIKLPNRVPSPELIAHADSVRGIPWP